MDINSMRSKLEQLLKEQSLLYPLDDIEKWNKLIALAKQIRNLQREIAKSNSEMYAYPLDIPLSLDSCTPYPYFFCAEHEAYLVIESGWNGSTTVDSSYLPSTDLETIQNSLYVVIKFEGFCQAKVGGPNDEVFDGHPLSKKGLEIYRINKVENSSWIKEVQEVNKVHRGYREENWKSYNHYIFYFHDTSYECIARYFKLEFTDLPLNEILSNIVKNLIPDYL